MRPWSYSALTLYETCPQAYKLRHIDKIKDEKNEAMIRGNQIHETLETYLAGGQLPREAEGLETFCNQLRDKSLTVEEEWGFTETWGVTNWYKDDIWCRMKLDVFVPSKDELQIIDWKTGKYYPIKAIDQGQLYAVGASLRSEADKFKVTFAYVDQNMVKSTTYKKAQVEKFKLKFTKRATILGKDTKFLPKPHTITCRYCPMKEHCQYEAIE